MKTGGNLAVEFLMPPRFIGTVRNNKLICYCHTSRNFTHENLFLLIQNKYFF
ncbi:hypothetical protein PGB90_007329 [Kerria lacca]